MEIADQKEYYDQSPDYFRRVREHDRAYFSEYLDIISHNARSEQFILDVGCGTGQAAAMLVRAGYRAAGVDNSRRFIEYGRAKYPGPDLKLADIGHLPFADKTFDCVASLNAVEHFLDPNAGLKEMIRVTKAGGRIVIVAPNLLSPRVALNAWLKTGGLTFEGRQSRRGLAALLVRDLKRLIRKKSSSGFEFTLRTPDFRSNYPDADSTWYANPVDLKKFFLRQGCRLAVYQNFDPIIRKKSPLIRALVRVFPEFMGIVRIVAVRSGKAA